MKADEQFQGPQDRKSISLGMAIAVGFLLLVSLGSLIFFFIISVP